MFYKYEDRGNVAGSKKKPNLFRISQISSGGSHFSLLSTMHYVIEMPLDQISQN